MIESQVGSNSADKQLRKTGEMEFALSPALLVDVWVRQIQHDSKCTRDPNELVFVQTFTEEPLPSLMPYAEPEWANVRHIALRCKECNQSCEDLLGRKMGKIESIVLGVVTNLIDQQIGLLQEERVK